VTGKRNSRDFERIERYAKKISEYIIEHGNDEIMSPEARDASGEIALHIGRLVICC